MPKKIRLDLLVRERFPSHSREQIQSWIMCGSVRVNGVVVNKAGTFIGHDVCLEVVDSSPRYVSRAGFKLEHALQYFALDVRGLIALDAGISTGGFTDCLLQAGARRVYGIDVGYAQVHEKVLRDERVVVRERTNLRYVRDADIGESVDLVTLDLSFISLLKVMDAVCSVLRQDGFLVALIKPQFEAQRHEVGRGGIVRDPTVHKAVIGRVCSGLVSCGFMVHGVTQSPLAGGSGNIEFFVMCSRC